MNHIIRVCLSIVVLTGWFHTGPAIAEPLTLESGIPRVALIELYTSEGCSSCPPADRWISELKTDHRLWRKVVPVAFHVDYWDYIGWQDRFAEPEYGERQRRHARQGNVRSVYTPGFVVAGEEWRSWFFNPSLGLANPTNSGNLKVTVDGKRLQAEFRPTVHTAKRLELHVALLGFELDTQVKAGENRGRRLSHDFVVLGYAQYPLRNADQRFQVHAALPNTRVDAPRQGLAVWVSEPGKQNPIQAVGGFFTGDG